MCVLNTPDVQCENWVKKALQKLKKNHKPFLLLFFRVIIIIWIQEALQTISNHILSQLQSFITVAIQFVIMEIQKMWLNDSLFCYISLSIRQLGKTIIISFDPSGNKIIVCIMNIFMRPSNKTSIYNTKLCDDVFF